MRLVIFESSDTKEYGICHHITNLQATSPVELGTVEFAAEVQEDAAIGCNKAPTRFPNHIGASSTENLPQKSNRTPDLLDKKGIVSQF